MPVSLVATKFDVYKDEDSPVIYDIDEERALRRTKHQTSKPHDSNMTRSRYRGINLIRKLESVFHIIESRLYDSPNLNLLNLNY